MTRKIIQIAVTAIPEQSDVIYALCDDGSVWSLWLGSDPHEWYRMKDVPEGKPNETT